MNEKKRSRREWVKTAAIIFLSVMLVLTFFSNTIMNYSLAEVATQYVKSGTITEKVRGTGNVESGSLYSVKIKESRKVTSVEVRAGDTVQIGDVICYLTETESMELEQARKELEQAKKDWETAQKAYELALLSGELDSGVIQVGGMTTSVAGYRDQILAAKALVADREKALNDQILVYNEAKIYKDSVDIEVKEMETRYKDLEFRTEHQMDVSSGDKDAMDALHEEKLSLSEQRQRLQNKLAAADLALQQATMNKENLEALLREANDDLAQLTRDINSALSLSDLADRVQDAADNVRELEDKVKKLEESAAGMSVTADVAGKIVSVSVVAGETTDPNTPVAVIQPEGKDYTLSFSVSIEQAKRISVGDPAELVNAWWYTDITATVASIKPDPQDPSRRKLITFNISGDVTEGQTLNLQVGQKSTNYDYIVPNSAIREDNNGKFILVVESRQSPLGTRYYATRYDVEVLASDDTQSAINAALEGYEYIITTASKPVKAGDMVRLPD